MVLSNTGLPDPDRPIEDLRVSNANVIVLTDDDSDQEIEADTVNPLQAEYGEYQPLPTFSNEELDTVSDNDTDNEDDANTNIGVTTTPDNSPGIPVPSITSVESALLKEVWSGPSPKDCDIEMDSKKVDEVKQAMLNITLPPSAIPDWAVNIPEAEWKHQLMKRLENIEEKSKN